jgi:hypothetical protein
MLVRNKKKGSNVLAFKASLQNIKVMFRAGETIDVKNLENYNQIINKADFEKRGWFEILSVENKKVEIEESNLEKAKKEVKNYTSEDK